MEKDIESKKWKKRIGLLLLAAGISLFVIGNVILLVKSRSIVTIMSLPVILFGFLIWVHSKNYPAPTKE